MSKRREFLALLGEGAHGPHFEPKPSPSKKDFLAQLRECADEPTPMPTPTPTPTPTPSKREILVQLREGAHGLYFESKPAPSKREFLAQLREWADEPTPMPTPTPSKREFLAQLREWADEPTPIHQAEENKVEDAENIRPPLALSSTTSVSRMSTSSPIATNILDLEGDIKMKSNKPRMDNKGNSISLFSEIQLQFSAAISIISFRIISTIIIKDYI